MSLSKIRTLANIAKNKIEDKLISSSANNFIFYGTSGGKSVLSASQLEGTILVLSPAGGSSHLENEFPNCVFYPIDSLDELESMIKDLEDNMNIIRRVSMQSEAENKDYKEKQFAKRYNGKDKKEIDSDWNDIVEYAKLKKFPFDSIVLEEINIVSTWLQDRVEANLEIEMIGADKSKMSSDWGELRKVLVSFYSRLLKLPVRTILSTVDKSPKEQQGGGQTTPDICQGAAAKQIISMVGNVMYVYKEGDRYNVRLNPPQNQSMLIRSKIAPVRNPIDIPDVMDITGKPEEFWKLISKLESIKSENTKVKK